MLPLLHLPKSFFDEVRMDYQEIIAGWVAKLNTFGTCAGRVKAGPMSFARDSGASAPAALHLREQIRASRGREPVSVAAAVHEAATKYLGWDVYPHRQSGAGEGAK